VVLVPVFSDREPAHSFFKPVTFVVPAVVGTTNRRYLHANDN
jgi:hypothetical protein